MGAVSEFFVATTAEFDVAFLMWLRPLDVPRVTEELDPTSGTTRIVTSWAPRPLTTEVKPHVRGPRPDLGGLPRLHLRGVTPAELATLGRCVSSDDPRVSEEEIRRPARIAPPGQAQWVHRVPDYLVETLAGLEGERLEALAQAWSDAELARLQTLEDEAVRIAREKHHRPAFWLESLRELQVMASMAHGARAGLFLYLSL